jgi:hypothetical protein
MPKLSDMLMATAAALAVVIGYLLLERLRSAAEFLEDEIRSQALYRTIPGDIEITGTLEQALHKLMELGAPLHVGPKRMLGGGFPRKLESLSACAKQVWISGSNQSSSKLEVRTYRIGSMRMVAFGSPRSALNYLHEIPRFTMFETSYSKRNDYPQPFPALASGKVRLGNQ